MSYKQLSLPNKHSFKPDHTYLFRPLTRHWWRESLLTILVTTIFFASGTSVGGGIPSGLICGLVLAIPFFVPLITHGLYSLWKTRLTIDKTHLHYKSRELSATVAWQDVIFAMPMMEIEPVKHYIYFQTKQDSYRIPLTYLDSHAVWSLVFQLTRVIPRPQIQRFIPYRFSVSNWAQYRAAYYLFGSLVIGVTLWHEVNFLAAFAPLLLSIWLASIVMTAGKLHFDHEMIRLHTWFLGTFTMKWEEIENIEHDETGLRLVLCGGDKRLPIFGPVTWLGSHKIDAYLQFIREVEERKLGSTQSLKTLFKIFPKNVRMLAGR